MARIVVECADPNDPKALEAKRELTSKGTISNSTIPPSR